MQITITPFAFRLPPTLFNALLAATVRSRVKLTFVGAEFVLLLQLSITAAGMSDKPHNAMVFFKKSFLSIAVFFWDNYPFKLTCSYVHLMCELVYYTFNGVNPCTDIFRREYKDIHKEHYVHTNVTAPING